MIRVSALRDQLSADLAEQSDDGLTAREQLMLVRKGVLAMEAEQTACLHEDLLPRLAAAGISVVSWEELDEERKEAARGYFRRNVLPVLTPLAVDPGHPFPFLSNLSLNLAIETKNPETGEVKFARVKMPPAIPRLLSLRAVVEGKKKVKAGKAEFLLLESLVQANLDELFPGLEILASYLFRITRDADIEIQEDEASDLLATIEQEVRRRRFGAVVRVEVTPKVPKRMRKLLMRQLEVSDFDIYEVAGLLGASDLMTLVKLDRRDLKDAPFTPALPAPLGSPDGSIFQAIRQGDILLHHPYDSFGPVVDLIEEAAEDPKTLAIKMTLYRTSSDSPVIPALIRAAENGKQVAVLVELKARFDEENNIVWAKALERAGVHVVYGVVGLKTHAKIALVVRREKDEIRRYVHLGTGNYNPTTAKVYTDLGLLTCRPEFGEDATRLFNTLTGLATRTSYNRLVTAPRDMHRTVREWIARETAHARAGRPARIRAKLNALVDRGTIEALYEASQAGRADRPDRPRRLLPRSRAARRLGDDPGPLHRRPLPRAQPLLPLRERRRARGLGLVGRLDAAQLLPARRGFVPDRRPRAGAAALRRLRRPDGRQREGPGASLRRDVRAVPPGARRARHRLAGVLPRPGAPPRPEGGRAVRQGRRDRRSSSASPSRANAARRTRSAEERSGGPRRSPGKATARARSPGDA